MKKNLNIATIFAALVIALSAIFVSSSVASAQTTYDGKQDARISALEAKRRGKGKVVRSKTPGRLSALESKDKTHDKSIEDLQNQRNSDLTNQGARDDAQDRDILDLDSRVNTRDDRLNTLATLIYNTGFWLVVASIVFGILFLGYGIVMGVINSRHNGRVGDLEQRVTDIENDHDGRITDAQTAADAAQVTADNAMTRANSARASARTANRRITRAVHDATTTAHQTGVDLARIEATANNALTTANGAANAPYASNVVNMTNGAGNCPAAGAIMRVRGGNFAPGTTAALNGTAVTVDVLNPNVIEFAAPAATAGDVAYVIITSGGHTTSVMFRYV